MHFVEGPSLHPGVFSSSFWVQERSHPPPHCDNIGCLQALPSVPLGAHLPSVRTAGLHPCGPQFPQSLFFFPLFRSDSRGVLSLCLPSLSAPLPTLTPHTHTHTHTHNLTISALKCLLAQLASQSGSGSSPSPTMCQVPGIGHT